MVLDRGSWGDVDAVTVRGRLGVVGIWGDPRFSEGLWKQGYDAEPRYGARPPLPRRQKAG